MESKQLFEAMRELEEKARRYEYRQSKDVEQVAKLQASISKIQESLNNMVEVLKFLDPTNSTGIVKQRKNRNIYTDSMETRKEIYQLLQNGTEISTGFLEKAYPDKNHVWINNMMTALAKMPNVDSRKEGQKKYLFARHG